MNTLFGFQRTGRNAEYSQQLLALTSDGHQRVFSEPFAQHFFLGGNKIFWEKLPKIFIDRVGVRVHWSWGDCSELGISRMLARARSSFAAAWSWMRMVREATNLRKWNTRPKIRCDLNDVMQISMVLIVPRGTYLPSLIERGLILLDTRQINMLDDASYNMLYYNTYGVEEDKGIVVP